VAVYDVDTSAELMNSRAHNRPVTDLSWSPFMPQMLASTSQDGDIHLWDVREPRKAVQTFFGWTCVYLQFDFTYVSQPEHFKSNGTD